MSHAVTTIAPRGSRCTECLCCDAVVVVDVDGNKETLCAACDDGTHPALAFTLHPQKPMEPETAKAVVTMVATAAAAMLPTKEEAMLTTPEQKEAIRNAPESERVCDLATRLGMPEANVSYYRSAFRKRAAKAPKAAKAATKKAAAKPSKGFQPERDTTLPRSANVSFDIPEKMLDRWWTSQTLDRKAQIFGTYFAIRVEGTVG